MKRKIKDVFKSTVEHKKRFMILCVLTGLVGGALAVGFHLAISGTFRAVWKLGGALGEENRWWLMPLMPAMGGLITGVCIFFFAKSAAGSGIPQTKACYYNDFGILKISDIVSRFFLGAIFCGFGNSAGREGPTVHMCSAVGSVIAQKMKFPKNQIRDAIPIGMASGIAASFNAPLSGISFVFEELFGGQSRIKNLGGMIVAVALSVALSRIILGNNPVINDVSGVSFSTGWWMLICLPIAICAGVVGDKFLALLLKLRGFSKNEKRIPKWLLPCAGGLAVGIMATFAYFTSGSNAVFSVGYSVLAPSFNGEVAIYAMFTVFLFKFICTIINYSLGGSGGLFSPAIVMGGTLGGSIAGALVYLFDLDKSLISAGVMLGMGACFASIIRCPITSVIMIFELTLNYSLILPLLVGNLISYYIAKNRQPVGLYDALLLQDKITLKKMSSTLNSGDWKMLPISTMMTFDPVCVDAADTCAAAFKKVSEHGRIYRAYPVLDNSGKLAGIINSSTLKQATNAEKTCAQASAKDFETVIPEAHITDVANMLVNKDLMEVCIVAPANEKKLVGIITLHDIMRQQNATDQA